MSNGEIKKSSTALEVIDFRVVSSTQSVHLHVVSLLPPSPSLTPLSPFPHHSHILSIHNLLSPQGICVFHYCSPCPWQLLLTLEVCVFVCACVCTYTLVCLFKWERVRERGRQKTDWLNEKTAYFFMVYSRSLHIFVGAHMPVNKGPTLKQPKASELTVDLQLSWGGHGQQLLHAQILW